MVVVDQDVHSGGNDRNSEGVATGKARGTASLLPLFTTQSPDPNSAS
jgi:hypothetical protein